MNRTTDLAPPLQLPAELTIDAVRELREQWLPALDEADTAALALQASAVQQVDAAGLQLLLALRNALAQRGRALQLHSPSAVLCAACQDLGLSALLQGAPAGEGA